VLATTVKVQEAFLVWDYRNYIYEACPESKDTSRVGW